MYLGQSVSLANHLGKLFFAIPKKMEDKGWDTLIPNRAGIIVVADSGYCEQIRAAEVQNKYKFDDSERYKLARLGAIRIWALKRKVEDLKKKKSENK